MFAVIKVGDKQYRVGQDEELVVDRVESEVGDSVELPVAFVADGDDFDLGPDGRMAKVEVLEHLKGEVYPIELLASWPGSRFWRYRIWLTKRVADLRGTVAIPRERGSASSRTAERRYLPGV